MPCNSQFLHCNLPPIFVNMLFTRLPVVLLLQVVHYFCPSSIDLSLFGIVLLTVARCCFFFSIINFGHAWGRSIWTFFICLNSSCKLWLLCLIRRRIDGNAGNLLFYALWTERSTWVCTFRWILRPWYPIWHELWHAWTARHWLKPRQN